MEGINEHEVTSSAKTDDANQRSWLQRLKDESWEAELLVSAIAIFGAFQLFGLIDWLTNVFIDILNPNQYLVGYAVVFLSLFAISILASMFVIHFVLRAYWIGLVGLNSVFPDYSIEDSAYSEIFTKRMLAMLPKLKDSIQKIDDLCSVIFSAAFTFMFIYVYIAIIVSLYLLIFNILSEYILSDILLIPVYLVAIGMILQLIVSLIANLKVNKNKKKLQVFNFKLVKIMSFIAYGPLYKMILQVSMIFTTNFKKKKSLSYLILGFILFGVFLSVFHLKQTNIAYLIVNKDYFDSTRQYSEFYKNQNSNTTFLLAPEVETDVVKGRALKVFIPIFRNERKIQHKACGDYQEDDTKKRTEQRDAKRQFYSNCYPKYNKVYLNDEPLAVEFYKYTHPKTDQRGITGYIEASKFKTGNNIITIKKEYNGDVFNAWSIPVFYAP